MYLILTKKFKDNDKKKDIIEAFEFINSDEPKKPVVEENTISEEQMIKSAFFYDKLIYNGYKYTDEMADVVLKQADPKNKTEFGYEKFTDHILKTVKKKKKRVTKKKK